MSETSIKIEYQGATCVMSWDGAQASAPIRVDGLATQYQTADARHRTADAVRLAARHVWGRDLFEDGSESWAQLGYITLAEEE